MWTLLVILAVLFALSRTQFEVRHTIEINAPVEKVWATIINFQGYDRWNSQLSYFGGEVAPGGRLHLRLAVSGATPYEFKPDISHWRERETFAWIARTGGLPRLFDGEHFFELSDLGNGQTRLVNREEYRGVLSPLMQRLPMMKLAPEGFARMNQELKAFVEQ